MHEQFARGSADTAIVTECAGMPVNQINDFAKKLRQAGVKLSCGKEHPAVRAIGGEPGSFAAIFLRGNRHWLWI